MKPKIKNFFCIAIGSALGLGLSPIAPGTFGTLLGVLLHIIIYQFFPEGVKYISLVLIFIAVCIANNVLAPWAEAYYETKDPQHFVLDEVAGYLLIPILFRSGSLWKTVLVGFILFRIFDIFKFLPPARQIDQNMQGGWGILLDDLVSSVYVVIVMYFLNWLCAGVLH